MTFEPITSSLQHKVVPPRQESPGPHPTLFLLHGRGTNEDDLLGLVPHLDPRLLIVSVRAPFGFPLGGYTWYEILQAGSPEPNQFAESYDRLVNFLGDAKRAFRIDPNRLFLMGFSMGTVMALALALTKPHEITGIVAHSGYTPEGTNLKFQWDDLQRTAFFVAHGRFDPVISVKLGRRTRELLSKTSAPLTYKEYPIAHQISEESLTDLRTWLTGQLDSVS